MFSKLLEVMRSVLHFEHAAVLMGHDDGKLHPVAYTSPLFENTQWEPQKLFQRVFSGIPVAAFSIRVVAEWQNQPRELIDCTNSALHAPLRSGESPAMLVCTHSKPAFFSNEHVNIAGRFAPLAAQALITAEASELAFRQRLLKEEKKAIEERNTLLQEARDKALEASRMKSDFLANMSHEIRTPMNAIIGMTGLALQGEMGSKERNFVEKAHRSAESLLGIINDILDFSKIEAGKLDIEAIDFDLEEVLDNVSNLVGLKAEDKGLELLFRISPDIPRQLIGDPLRLSQVLINLGSNAVKFTDTGGEVVVEIAQKASDEQGILIQFSVRDNGIGMTEEQLSKLFQSFSQADTSTTRKYGGTGLGLAICKRLTEMMGGEIGVDSEYAQGSTFTFTVRLRQQADQRPAKKTAITDLSSLHALVVDDNATARQILVELLARLGIAVTQASSAAEAIAHLEQADSHSPSDIVLMDWRMPGMDGISAASAIQKNPKLRHVPTIVMVTAYGREEAQQAAQGLQLGGFLTKPVTSSTLLDTLLGALGHQTTRSGHADNRQEKLNKSSRQLRGAHLLLVEDNEFNQELAYELLTRHGIRVEIANNGQESLDALEQRHFDGVLMDCQMPLMDGYEATRLIRAQDRFKGLPVIAMTANAMVGDKEKVLAAGMNDHIAKPINVNDMFNTLAKWIKPAQPAEFDQAPCAEVQERQPPSQGLPEFQHIDAVRGAKGVGGSEQVY
ncbi:MAG: response regulator, partial [Gammaproteobacteria bacterium]|nr:response regulator [Gammaproteobacteria bacterium]